MKEGLCLLIGYLPIALSIYKIPWLKLKGYKAWVSLGFFTTKVVAGFMLWFIYTAHYNHRSHSDIFKFYDDGLLLKNMAENNSPLFWDLFLNRTPQNSIQGFNQPLQNWNRHFDSSPINANRTMIRLQAIIHFFSFGHYSLHLLVMCFLAYIGWVLLYNSVAKMLCVESSLFSFTVLLLPSALLWSSGVLKEAVLVFGLGLFFQSLTVKNHIFKMLLLAAAFFVIAAVKFYVLCCMLPALLAFAVFKKYEQCSIVCLKYACMYAGLLWLVLQLPKWGAPVNLMPLLVEKQANSIREAHYYNAGSITHLPPLQENIYSLLKAIPTGITNVFLQPMPHQANKWLLQAALLENVIVIGIILLCVLMASKPIHFKANVTLLLWGITFSYFVLIGITTPVIGNLVRYKSVMLPLFLFPFVSLLNTPRLLHPLPLLYRLNTFCCEK